jgi:pimeloyl-ACP methyl ester carboxylesterase
MKTWLLLRGLGRDKRHWGTFVEDFVNTFSDDRVLTIDTLGNGDFCRVKSPLVIRQYTNHCRKQLAELENGEQINLVALSLGGMVALDWAHRYPAQVASLTLLNTSASNLTPPYQRMRFNALSQLLYAFLLKRNDHDIEQAIVDATSNVDNSQSVVDCWTKYRHEKSTSIANTLRQLVAAARFTVKPVEDVPVLVLVSKKDRIVNPQAGVDLSRFLSSTLKVHPSAGHDLPLDADHWVTSQIKNHFERLS